LGVVSIYLAIYSNRLTAFLPQEIVPAVQDAGLPASSIPDLFAAVANGTAAALEMVPGMSNGVLDALVLATKHAQAHAFKVVYLATLAFTGIGLIAAFFITDVNAYLTNYVNKTIHKPKMGNSTAAEV
jgi:Fungal trichothecene efflux pump (TRI12)